MKGKEANGVGSQASFSLTRNSPSSVTTIVLARPALQESQYSTELTPPPIYMDSSVSLEDRIWFLRVCHHVPFVLYMNSTDHDAPRSAVFSCVLLFRALRPQYLPQQSTLERSQRMFSP